MNWYDREAVKCLYQARLKTTSDPDGVALAFGDTAFYKDGSPSESAYPKR